jgi:DNA-binding transcriptional MerR regulator
LTIGAAADLVGVATSTLRYYERRGLVVADARVSGQRRYRWSTVRRLVFVQMLQDAGLSLDDIQGVLEADDNASWKEIAHQRLTVLDDEITKLHRARDILAGALLCRYDHPLDECQVMNGEIDRRLADHGDVAPSHLDPTTPSDTAGRVDSIPGTETDPAPFAS